MLYFPALKTRQLKGVRENYALGKQICILSEDLKGTIEPNVLYSVELKPMHKAKGYVVVAAFDRTVSCDSRDHNYSSKYQKLYTLVYILID
jgi:hypothetical protein